MSTEGANFSFVLLFVNCSIVNIFCKQVDFKENLNTFQGWGYFLSRFHEPSSDLCEHHKFLEEESQEPRHAARQKLISV